MKEGGDHDILALVTPIDILMFEGGEGGTTEREGERGRDGEGKRERERGRERRDGEGEREEVESK